MLSFVHCVLFIKNILILNFFCLLSLAFYSILLLQNAASLIVLCSSLFVSVTKTGGNNMTAYCNLFQIFNLSLVTFILLFCFILVFHFFSFSTLTFTLKITLSCCESRTMIRYITYIWLLSHHNLHSCMIQIINQVGDFLTSYQFI